MTDTCCEKCSGEGTLYKSRYGGNDPDVWPAGKCEVCNGTGRVPVEEDEPLDEHDRQLIDEAWEIHKAALPVARIIDDNQSGNTAIIEILISPPTLVVGTELFAAPQSAFRKTDTVFGQDAASPAIGVQAVTDAAQFLLSRLRHFSDAPSDSQSDDRWHFSVLPAMRMLEAALHPAPEAASAGGAGEPFQNRVQPWMMACFGPEISGDRVERGDRLLEEVFELLQSGGYDPARVLALRDYVWGREKGEPVQEVGGVMVTLAAYCLAHELDMHEAGETELARIWTKVEKIRAKQAAKPVGSALPVAPSDTASPAAAGKVKPLDLSHLIRDAFLSGRGLKDGDKLSEADQAAFMEYDPTEHVSYKRIYAALHPAPEAASAGAAGEVERLADEIAEARRRLAAWDINSLPNDMPLLDVVDARIDDLRKYMDIIDNLPFQREDIQRGLILFRTSNNAHGLTNFVSLTARVEALPQAAKDELASMMRNIAEGLSPVSPASDAAPSPKGASDGVRDVLAERRRQIEAEGWDKGHDDEHEDGSLAQAAACYAHPSPRMGTYQTQGYDGAYYDHPLPKDWPRSWSGEYWKPKERRRDLVRAGALILAEIERLDRAALSQEHAPGRKESQ